MSKMIHVPDAVHRKLKNRAQSHGMSLSDFLVREVTEIAETPTEGEVLARIRSQVPVVPREPVAETVRRMPDAR